MADDVAEDKDFLEPTRAEGSLEREQQYSRQFALDYAIRIESLVRRDVRDINHVFETAQKVAKFVNTGIIDD